MLRYERRFVIKNVGQGIITKLSVEPQSASKLLISAGKCSVAIKVPQVINVKYEKY